jgi:transcriptional regulator with XRE-family HTH domain
MATIGENIKTVSNKLGLTQDDLVRKSGVKHTTLTKIESNVVVKPSVQTVAKIAKALSVPMEDLVQ